MAPKVVVPADFGIENLNCEFHNNVVFKLEGGEEMKANSLILSYHSSEFVRLFLELNQSVLEMDDFSKESVKIFLEALYSGEIQLDRNLFRDVNKMCHVFKVDWLSRRCGEYFESLVGDIRPSTDYQTLLFLFEEARFSVKVMKSNMMIDIVLKKICGLENRAELFAERYMKNYKELGTDQLDLMLHTTKNNPVTLLKIMKKNVACEPKLLDDVSRYLLQHIDLSKCIRENRHLFEDIFDILDKITSSCDHDALFVNKLYRSSVRESLKTNDEKAIMSEQNVNPLKAKILPHIFCSLEAFMGLSSQEYFQKMKESPLVLNLYMLIEGLQTLSFARTVLTPKMVREIEETRRKRSWSRILPEFISPDHCHPDREPMFRVLSNQSIDLRSNNESCKRVGKIVGTDNKISRANSCRLELLFLTPLTFAFYLKHPNNADCKLPGKCGFLLKFDPQLKSGQPSKFKVELCLDQEEYPDGLHIHPELVQADKIHLTLALNSKDSGNIIIYCHASITWNGQGVRGIINENSRELFAIGSWEMQRNMDIKVIAFVSL